MTYWTTTGSENLRGDTLIRQVVGAQPREVGRYQVLEVIGEGGMGTVYKCVGSTLGDQDLVAVKLFKKPVANTNSATREALLLSQLDHPNVARFRDFGLFNERPFVVMRLYSAGNLTSWLAQRKRSWSEILPILEGVARGLHYMHQQGVLHLDVKPHNILFDRDGQPRLADFGISTLISEAKTAPMHTESAHNTIQYFTRRYASPEQLRGSQLDGRSDQFSFCQMIQVDVVRNAFDRMPRRVQQVVARGTAEAPSERFESMSQLLHALTGNRKRRLRNILLASLSSLLLGGAAVSAAPSLGELIHPCQTVSLAAPHWVQHKQAILRIVGPETLRTTAFLDSAVHNSTSARQELCESTTFNDRDSARFRYIDNCLTTHDETVRVAIDLLPDAAKNLPAILETLDELANEPSVCLRARVEETPANSELGHPLLDDVVARLIRAQLLNGFGDYEASRTQAEAALESLGNSSRAELLRGKAHLQLGQTLTAETSYQQAMVHLREAEALSVKTRHYPLLLDALNGMLTVSRKDTNISKTAGLEVIGRAEQIAKWVDDPKRIATYLNLRAGMHLVCGEPPDLALQDLEKALRTLDSDDTHALVLRSQIQSNIAAIHLGQGRASDAATIYTDIITKRDEVLGPLHPETNAYRHNYANALIEMGRYEDALNTLLDVIEYEEQTGRSPLRILAYAYPDALYSALASGSLEMADILATQLGKLADKLDTYNQAATALSLAEYFTATGRVDEALDYVCRAIDARQMSHRAEVRRIQLATADALLIGGDLRQATRIYRQVFDNATSDENRGHAAFGLSVELLIDNPSFELIARTENLAENLEKNGQDILAARAFDLAAQASRSLGDLDQAKHQHERALRALPNITILATPRNHDSTITLPCSIFDAL